MATIPSAELPSNVQTDARTADRLASARFAELPPTLAVTLPLVTVILYAFITRSLLWSGVALLGSLALIATRLPLFAAASRTERQVGLLLVVVVTFCLPVAAWRGETAVIHFAVALLMFGAAFLITRDGRAYLKLSLWMLLLLQGAVVAYLTQSGLANFPLERMIPDSSSNGITSYLIVLQVNYCVVRYTLERKASFVTPLLTLLICVVGHGRSSLLVSAAILALNLATLVSPRRPLRALVSLLVLASVSTFTWVRYGDDIAYFLYANTKIGGGLYDSARELQIREYAAQLDGVALLIGGDYRGTSIESKYNNNPHNSYIRAHYIFGLPYLTLMLAIPFLMVSSTLPWGQRGYAFAGLALMLLRASTEPILFPTMLDLFFFGLCFILASPAVLRREERV